MRLEQIGFYTLNDERARTSSPTSRMRRGELILTQRCNFRCPYCRGLSPWIYGDRQSPELTFEEACHYLDLWDTNGVPIQNVRFSGGEPTVVKWLPDLVSYASRKGIERIAISTNGSAPTRLYEDLVDRGVSDFSISLDACNPDKADEMAGRGGHWETVVENIRTLSRLVYVTVGVVFTPENVSSCIEVVQFASELGVSDIRIISSAQYDGAIGRLSELRGELLERHPILRYRVRNYLKGRNVRGLRLRDNHRCPLALDDSIIAGDFHFPCVIHMREKGDPIGKVGGGMREDRVRWSKTHDTWKDPICRKNCLDICIDYNNRHRELGRRQNPRPLEGSFLL